MIETVPSDDAGAIGLDARERMINGTVGLIAMTWTPTNDRLHPRGTVAALRDQRINIGAPSTESTRLNSEARGLPILLRAAPHYCNTSEELDRLTMALTALPHR